MSAGLALAAALGALAGPATAETPGTAAGGGGEHSGGGGGSDWPSYGHGPEHTFHGRTTLTEGTAPQLRQAWSFPTGDAVTATPTVVDGTVYVGSWDGYFYALDLRTGHLRWKFQLSSQPAVTPFPGQNPRDGTSDGGLVTSSAWFEPGNRSRPALVIFGGGYTLYALDSATGSLVWRHDYTGRPDLPPDPQNDSTRIFSSPVVVAGKVIVGVSVDGERGHRGYIVAADLRTGDPAWEFQTDVDANGQVLNDGCGNVWSSGTVIHDPDAVVFDVADCHTSNLATFAESVIALRPSDGHLVWLFRPARADQSCDLDFGATVNASSGGGPGDHGDGRTTFLGVGGKDGTYYSLDPRNGQLRWSTNVVFGGTAGGFIGTAAFDGHRVYGSTALGDFGNGAVCDPSNPRDRPFQEPTVHAFDARTGAVVWEATGGASFGPTTVGGGMTFNGLALNPVVQVRDTNSGSLLAQLPLSAPCWSGIATVGDALVLGTGSSNIGAPAGVVAFTPGGSPPIVGRG